MSDSGIEALLHTQVIGRLGCHSRGVTYVVPVTYAYLDGAIVCHTGNGLKVRMMRENPRVCFEVEDLSRLPQWSCAILQGHYEELAGDTADAALAGLVRRLEASPPAATARPWQGAGVHEPVTYTERPDVVFRVVIDEKTGRYEV